MKVVVLVPRRADGGQRDRVWRWLKPRLPTAWPVVEGHHDDGGPFNRSAAINRAAAEAGAWDVAIVNDADCYVPHAQLELAVRTESMTVAFDEYCYLSQAGTEDVLAGGDLRPAVEFSDSGLGASPFAITRDLWDRVGGFDEGFVGWGYEDNDFEWRVGNVDRIPGPMFHLWHPPAEPDPATFATNQARLVARHREQVEAHR